MQKEGNNFAFIDSQNLNRSIRDLGWYLDFKRFRAYLKEKYAVSKAYLFIGYIPQNEHLYTSLRRSGYILIFKPITESEDGKIKGNVDAELVLHSMIEYLHYDQAVIVSGDGDFYCLVDYLNKQNKLYRLLIPNAYAYSSFFKSLEKNKIDFINNLREKLEYKKSR